MVTIYMELVLLDNLEMNYLILFFTSKLAAIPIKIYRNILSALLGAIYGVLYLLPGFNLLRSIWFKLLLSLAMVAIGFGISKRTLRALGVFYGVTFLLGGVMFGLLYFLGTGTIQGGLMLFQGFPIRYFLLGGMLAVVGVQIYWRWASRRLGKESRVRVALAEEKELVALVDTGHNLYEPLSGYPVVVLDYENAQEILPAEVREGYIQGKAPEQILEDLSGTEWESRARLIPYLAMGQAGFLLAFRPKKLLLYRQGWVPIKRVYVAVSKGSIQKESGFSVLLPAVFAKY